MTLRLALLLPLSLTLSLAAAPLAADPARRIVSLGGSVTETIAALGAADRLAGRDSTSTFPTGVLPLPDVGYIRRLTPEGVLSLTPDLILAEADAGPPETVALLRAAGIPYEVVPGGTSAQDVGEKITRIAAALELPEEGAALRLRTETEMGRAAARAAEVTTPARVLFVLALQSGRINAAGEDSSAAAILALAGAENALSGFRGYKEVSDEAILAADPDVILMMDNGAAGHLTRESLAGHPVLSRSRAFREDRVILMDGLKLLGFGPRTGEAALELHEAIYGAAG